MKECSSSENTQETERVLESLVDVTLHKLFSPPTYDIYFTNRRVIFAKIADYIYPAGGTEIITSVMSTIGEAAEKHKAKEKRAAYAKMTPQEIADAKDSVGVFYDEITSVVVKGKRLPEIEFTFSRKQKLGWEKAEFIIYGGPNFDQTVKSAGQILRRILPNKLIIQLQSPKLLALFGIPPP